MRPDRIPGLRLDRTPVLRLRLFELAAIFIPMGSLQDVPRHLLPGVLNVRKEYVSAGSQRVMTSRRNHELLIKMLYGT